MGGTSVHEQRGGVLGADRGATRRHGARAKGELIVLISRAQDVHSRFGVKGWRKCKGNKYANRLPALFIQRLRCFPPFKDGRKQVLQICYA